MKILIIALSGIGDALMFTPTLDKIQAEFPNAKIEALVMLKGVKNILEKLPQISTVHFVDFLKNPKYQSLKFVLKMRKKYDISINVYPSNRKEYNLISWLIAANKRLATKYMKMDFANFGFLNNVRIAENHTNHNVETNFKMVENLSNNKKIEISQLKIVLENADFDFANKFFSKKNINENELVIGFHLGCSTLKNHINRRWEVRKFAELAEKLTKNLAAKILLFGAKDEDDLKNSVQNFVNSANVISVETPDLTSSAAIMKRCNLFITNDSGLMHIAAALQLNIIPIIGPTNANFIHPWQTNYRIASLNLECSPCFFYSPKPLNCNLHQAVQTKYETVQNSTKKYKCLRDLPVDLVYNEAISMLTEQKLLK